MTHKFIAQLRQRPLLCDGAMGTMIYSTGIPFERCFDEINISLPAVIADIHRGYIDAGADVIQTNTFGANRIRLREHGLENSVVDINHAGVELARRVVDASFKEVFVAGTVGPLGQWVAPLGRLGRHDARSVFHEQLEALLRAGVDLLIFDTFADITALKEAVLAAREISPDVPIVAQVTFNEDLRTALGHSPQKVVDRLAGLVVDIIGVNCSLGPSGVFRALRYLSQSVPEGVFLSAQPNAGWPERRAGRIMYPATPEYFGEYALAFVEAGARLVGGCCGTTPAHIGQMRSALDDPARHSAVLTGLPGDEFDRAASVSILETTQLARRLKQDELVVTVEISPPKGYSVEKTLTAVELLKTAGANTINVADSPRARMHMSPWALCHLIQDRVGLETLLHFPTRGRNILRIQGDLLAAHALNVRNIFAVMGDPTTIGDYPDAMNDYDVVPTGLITLLKQRFNQGVDHGGEPLAQPTNFVAGCAVNLTPSDPDRELKVLQRKIESGADFALTQPVYDVAKARDFIAQYEARYGPWSLPIIAGVLPLYSGRHAEFLHNEVPGIDISADLQSRMRHAGNQAAQEGIKIALELVEQFRQFVQGIYLIPAFGRYDLVAEVIEQVS